MADVDRYELKSGHRWRVRYRTPSGKQTDKRGFKTKAEAKRFAATVEVDKMTGSYVSPSLGLITIGELGPGWLERKKPLKASTWRPLEITWRVHVEPRWGTVQINKVDVVEVEAWIAELSAVRSPTVVIRAYGILASILDDAVRSKRLYANPARGIENLPKKKRKRHVYLTHEQVHQLATAAKDRGIIVLVLAYCGLRWGELAALRVRHLDLLRRRILIEENAVGVGRKVVVGTTKGHEKRTVPLPRFLVEPMAKACEGKGRDGLMFPGKDGSHQLAPRTGSGWLDGAVGRAKLTRVTAHDLRHTAASMAVSAGANVKALQRMLGHASAAMTLDVYADLFDDDLDGVADALDQVVSKMDVGKMWAEAPAVGD